MPTLMRDKAVKYSMYYNDHDEPHVHAEHQRTYESKIEIGSLEAKTSGKRPLPPQRLADAVEWVKLNKDALIAVWGAMEEVKKDPSAANRQKLQAATKKLKGLRTAKRDKRRKRKAKRIAEALKLSGGGDIPALSRQTKERIAKAISDA